MKVTISSVLNFRSKPLLRLLYDFRWMHPGEAGGVEQASHELVSAIGRLDRKNAYRILAPRSAISGWNFPAGFLAKRVYSDPEEPAGHRLHDFVARCMAEAAGGDPTRTRVFKSREWQDTAFDLVHSTASFIHPELIEFPGVLTIQDLQHLHYPQFFDRADWDDRERLYRVSANRARHIICSSEFTRLDVHRRYGVPLERMTTIWVIPSASAWEEMPAPVARDLLARLRIDAPYLLYPAQGWPHKNHRRLLEAFERAVPRLPSGLQLVLTGKPFDAGHEVPAMLRQEPFRSRVRHLGFRSTLEIRALLESCTALFFPSLFEGFGMPVAEAIIAGRPVACSNVAALPEVAGGAALMFDPLDVDAIADAMVAIATRDDLREQLLNSARARRRLFSARDTALKTLAVYDRAREAPRG